MSRSSLARSIYDAAHLTGTFRLRSGQTSDEYFDKFRFQADPVLLAEIAEAMVPLVPDDVDALAGLQLGGIPLVTALSRTTGLPARFVRLERKTYATEQIAEGGPIDGLRLAIVEDVVTTGGQIASSAEDLRAEGATVEHALCVVDREQGAPENLSRAGLELRSLFRANELMPA